MKRYITILIFTFICFFTFRSVCWADVNGVFPKNGSTVDTREITFQWENDDSSKEYAYMIDVGNVIDSTQNYFPRVGISIANGTSYTYSVPKEFGNNILWWVKYCPKNQNPCEHVLSTIIYSFAIAEDATSTTISTPLPVIQQPQVKAVSNTNLVATKVVEKIVAATPVTVKPKTEVIETMNWNVNTSDLPKPFAFPFKEYIGVTQWHGNTAFQKPHTGIDFGAVKKEILAIGDGTIIAKGWDNYNGECLSGGNYILVKHTNGMYSSYFHLKKISVKVGQKVKKGEVLGISGNTGSWNCQPLAYHLHFETRLGRSQSTHVNPVDYIATNWSKVLTLNYKTNKGRLSGDNPHPKF
ncbi:M23 family metallopeptidase [Patescibacteria group bacterium]|nr:M23 family metallopeptidase [Patescibacteria group bacterium]